jgi:hypothetical protein
MKLKNILLVDQNNEVIKIQGKELSVSQVFGNAAWAPTGDGKPRSKRHTMERYDLGLQMFKLAVDEYFEIDSEVFDQIDEDIRRLYTTMIAGQILQMVKMAQVH